MSVARPVSDVPSGAESGPASFERVFHENAAFVFRALRRLGVSDPDADDACQEVFLVVHKKLATFHGGAVRTWLYAICIRVASEYRRRPHRRREDVVAAVPDEAVPARQDADVESRRELARLDAALDTLDEEKRAVFVLFEIEGQSMTEVAKAAGCPLKTAYSRLYAARDVVEAALRDGKAEGAPPAPRRSKA